MTVKLGSHTFENEPSVEIGTDALLAAQQKHGGGQKKDYAGQGVIAIKLEGKLTGANKFTDRDALLALISGGSTIDFYADAIEYGSLGSPKSVWVKAIKFVHTVGTPRKIPYVIMLEEET